MYNSTLPVRNHNSNKKNIVPNNMTRPPTRLVTLMQMLSESQSELLSTTVVSLPEPSVNATSPGDSTWYTTNIRLLIHCNENPIYVFLFWEMRGLSPNFHIHVSVSHFYIPRSGPHISCSRIGRSIVGINKSISDTWSWKLGLSVAAQFLFWEYLFVFPSNFRYLYFAVYRST